MKNVRIAASIVALTFAGAALAQDDVKVELAQKHVALTKKLEKEGAKREVRAELLLALELSPDDATARAKLGYTRDGNVWKGSPERTPKSRDLSAALKKERADLHKDASVKLAIAARGANDRALAALALDEDPNEANARAILGHEKRGAFWSSARDKEVRGIFDDAAKAAKDDEPSERAAASAVNKEAAGDDGLEKLFAVGKLARRESDRAVFLASKDSGADLVEIAHMIDTVKRAWFTFLPKDEKPPVEGEAPKPRTRARWLVLAPGEHDAFVERVVEKNRRALAKQLRTWTGVAEIPETNEKIYVFECGLAPSARVEWAALTAVKTLIQQTVPRGTAPPGFLIEGLTRFFAGRATGKAEISFLSTKVSMSVKERAARTFDDFRGGVREALAGSAEGDLRRVVTATLNDLEDQDSELAFAFIEFAVAKKLDAFRSFVKTLAADTATLASFEKAFGNVDEVERDFRAWAREEY